MHHRRRGSLSLLNSPPLACSAHWSDNMGLLRPDPLLVIGPPLSPEQRAAPVQLPPAHPDPAGFINELESGAVFRHFDFLAVFDEKTSLRPRDIEPLRRVGDPLADEAVDILGLAEVRGRGKDALKAIEEYLEEKDRHLGAERWEAVRKEDVVARLWDEMRNEPPEGVRGYAADAGGKEDRRATPYDAFEPTVVRFSLVSLVHLVDLSFSAGRTFSC